MGMWGVWQYMADYSMKQMPRERFRSLAYEGFAQCPPSPDGIPARISQGERMPMIGQSLRSKASYDQNVLASPLHNFGNIIS